MGSSLAQSLANAAKERRKRMGFIETRPLVLISRPARVDIENEYENESENEPVEYIQGRVRPRWPERLEIKRRNLERKEKAARVLDEVTRNVCLHFNVKYEHIRQYRRPMSERIKSPHAFTVPQYVAFWLCKRVFDLTYPEIGRHFSRDHTTVIYGVERMDEIILENPSVALSVTVLRSMMLRDEDEQNAIQEYWGA